MDSKRTPRGVQTPRARARSTATYTATSTRVPPKTIHDLSLGRANLDLPVDNSLTEALTVMDERHRRGAGV